MKTDNFLTCLPLDPSVEHFEDIVKAENVRIERIVSYGQTTQGEWYDQSENEWVMVLQGRGVIAFEDLRIAMLEAGEYVLIPAHLKHKVIETDPDQATIWLAIFYK